MSARVTMSRLGVRFRSAEVVSEREAKRQGTIFGADSLYVEGDFGAGEEKRAYRRVRTSRGAAWERRAVGL